MWCRVGLFSIKTTFLQQQQKNVYSAGIRISRDRHCHWPLQRASQREVLFTLVTVPSLKFHFGFSNIRAHVTMPNCQNGTACTFYFTLRALGHERFSPALPSTQAPLSRRPAGASGCACRAHRPAAAAARSLPNTAPPPPPPPARTRHRARSPGSPLRSWRRSRQAAA